MFGSRSKQGIVPRWFVLGPRRLVGDKKVVLEMLGEAVERCWWFTRDTATKQRT